MDRDKYQAMISDWLDEAERTMEAETDLLRRNMGRRASKPMGDDIDRHMRSFVRFQVGRERQEDIGERRTVADAVKSIAEELDLTRRSTTRKKIWSLGSALRRSTHG